MDFIRGSDRDQVHLLPPCVEEYVPREAPVRVIDAFVDGLDLRQLGFKRATPKATGRPGYHPADLLKLYVYGYLNRIRSSRRLEAEAARNLELMWLLRMLRPDFKTIADFRKDNQALFKSVLRQFNLLCRKLGLFGAELVAIDGSKFKALNSSHRNYTAEQVRELISRVEVRIDDYLRELDSQDAAAEGASGRTVVGDAQFQDKLKDLRSKRGRYEELLKEMQQSAQSEVSLTDADARKMKNVQQGGFFIGYNVQAAVDTKHDLIAAAEVVQSASDRAQLGAMASAASEELAAPALQVVADKGYHSAEQLAHCEAAGVVAFVPEQGSTSGRSSKDGSCVFGKERFRYDAAADGYHCPGAALLKRRSQSGATGKALLYANAAACRQCALRSQCTAGIYRVITRRVNEAAVERAAQRLAGCSPEMMAKRRQSVEHVFGTLRTWGHDTFLLKGLAKVRAEFSLSALTYNLRRVLNLKTVPELLQVLQRSAVG